ncbi:hypothetical protein B9479_004323 [Cryptococcus floricola]|uniref:N-acetyltransferase domain-containing protein n=1 Tax=Cryptococcus floricola TaxID=2591691 RepID=A0A5D3AVZ4_9TREE|nr:hypothetical protein B9479_004323 [Cryptococcus floricola]
MGDIKVRLLQNPTDQEFERILDVYQEGFVHEQLAIHTFGSNTRDFFRSRVQATLVDLQLWVVELDGEIGCVGIVSPPGKDLWDTEEKTNIRETVSPKISPAIKQWQDAELEPLHEKRSLIPGGGPEAVYYLHLLSAHPSFQKKGLGTSLLGKLEELARRDGSRVALETHTDGAASVYRKNGFRTLFKGVLDFKSELGTGPYYVMVNDCGLSP